MVSRQTVRQALYNHINQSREFTEFHYDDLVRSYRYYQRTSAPRVTLSAYEQHFKENLPEPFRHSVGIRPGSSYSEDFFQAVMDEPRQYYADFFARFILFRNDMIDANFFRKSLSKREMARDMEYPDHRDHAAHTVNNYLLGWFFFEHSRPFRDAFERKANHLNRKLPTGFDPLHFFGFTWVNVSLMHDTGYLFEGSIKALDVSTHNENIRRGASIVHDFFYHRFWLDSILDQHSVKHVIQDILGFEVMDYNGARTLIQLGDLLTALPDINQIKSASTAITSLVNKNLEFVDSFELWRVYTDLVFEEPGDKRRSKRINLLKAVYYDLMYNGMSGSGVRLVDHGIASGLLMLLYHSFFYTLYFQIRNTPRSFIHSLSPSEQEKFHEVTDFIVNQLPYDHFRYSPEWYFTGVLWSTSAAALHNVLQIDPDICFDELGDGGRLSMDEDPLAYLGVLVDLVQEWDRNRADPGTTFIGKLPAQSHEVEIEQRAFNPAEITSAFNFSAGRSPVTAPQETIGIYYHNRKLAEKVGTSLKKALAESWKYVLIFAKEP